MKSGWKLRLRDQLVELNLTDLSFNAEETARLVQQQGNIPLSDSDIQILARRTEGWIAGLQAVILSLRGQPSEHTTDLLQRFSGTHRYIFDYFAEEVLSQQPDDIPHQFLEKTAILNRLSGPLCNAVTGRDDSQNILETLEMSHLFIVPLDDERQWYRYHHLFADFLRARLQKSLALADEEP